MKKILLLLTLFSGFNLVLQAQPRVVRGTLKDADGPLSSASVYEKDNVTNGTVTNSNGTFQLSLRGTNNILVVNFVGYLSQEVIAAGRTNIVITLVPDTKGLEEVIVVGYGTQKKITNTGAVSTVTGKSIRDVPTANIQNTLAGRLPGFFSQQRSGAPGRDAADFFIRGVTSLNSSGNQPLIIVDDIEYTYNQVAQLDANSPKREYINRFRNGTIFPMNEPVIFKLNKSFTVGLIIPNLLDQFYVLAINGVEAFAEKENYNVIFSQSHEAVVNEEKITNVMIRNRVDGVIVAIKKRAS